MVESLLKKVDHLVYSTTDLEESVAELEDRFGVRAAYGGRHPGRGTRNALIAVSDWSYLEIVGPDPTQPGIGVPRWFGIDTVTVPRLITWAAKGTEISRLAREAARLGVPLGPVVSGSRESPDGATLHWQFTDPATVVADGLMPFFIDWGSSPHPAAFAPRGLQLVSLRAQHPEPLAVERALSAVGLSLPVAHGPRPTLIATLRTKRGDIELQ